MVKPGRDSTLLAWVTHLPLGALLRAVGHCCAVNLACAVTGEKTVG